MTMGGTYIGIGCERGKAVPEEEALQYALTRCGVTIVNPGAQDTEEFEAYFLEWFFSGNWRFEASKEDVSNA